MVCILRSCVHRLCHRFSFWRFWLLMKFPAEPESMRAYTETQTWGFRICTVILVRGAIRAGSWIVLTGGRGGRIGQAAMAWSSPSQYKHRSWRILLWSSLKESTCICSGAGRATDGMVGSYNGVTMGFFSEHLEKRWATQMVFWKRFSSPIVSS